jgi:hypothetical protein
MTGALLALISEAASSATPSATAAVSKPVNAPATSRRTVACLGVLITATFGTADGADWRRFSIRLVPAFYQPFATNICAGPLGFKAIRLRVRPECMT